MGRTGKESGKDSLMYDMIFSDFAGDGHKVYCVLCYFLKCFPLKQVSSTVTTAATTNFTERNFLNNALAS